MSKKTNLPMQIGYFVYQYAKLRMLEVYYEFMDVFVKQTRRSLVIGCQLWGVCTWKPILLLHLVTLLHLGFDHSRERLVCLRPNLPEME
jgi:hypothetical protein